MINEKSLSWCIQCKSQKTDVKMQKIILKGFGSCESQKCK